MEYKQHPVIKKIIADSNKAFATCSFDILSINPNSIPKYARLVSRYQDLIRHYDKLNDFQQSTVQSSINAVTKQLTLLLKLPGNNAANPAKAIYLLGVIGHIEKTMLNQLSSTTTTTITTTRSELSC